VRQREFHPAAGLALAADHLSHLLELKRHAFVGGNYLVKGIGDFPGQAGVIAVQRVGNPA
jgi:hypothetical protein